MDRFLIKVLLNGIIVIPLLMWFSQANFISAVVASVILTVIAYFIGDQLILRASNNTAATVADFILAFAYLWAAEQIMGWGLSYMEIFITALVLGVVEAGFHRYLAVEKDAA